MTHKQVIVMRKDLNMRKGKMVAQGAHASMAVILNLMTSNNGADNWDRMDLWMDDRTRPWIHGNFKKICVSVNSEVELLELHQKAKDCGILTSLIQDSGLTEFGGVATNTCIAIGPDLESKIDEITGQLPLL